MSLRLNELARRCLRTGPEDKVYQVVKLAMVIDALAAEGISVEDALAGRPQCAHRRYHHNRRDKDPRQPDPDQ